MSTRSRLFVSVVSLSSLLALLACTTGRSHVVRSGIGPSGGTLVGSSGARLEVPAGAVSLATEFTMLVQDGVAALPAGARATGSTVTMGPAGITFAERVTLVLPAAAPARWVYTRASAEAPWTRIDDGVWDAVTHTITVRVAHFSDFVPAGDSEPPAVDCTDPAHARDPECVAVMPVLPSCDAVTQDCAVGEKCIATDQEGGYDWGDGRPARCIAAGAGVRGDACDDPTDCERGHQCVFATMHDETTVWFSQEASYLPMYTSVCLPVCALEAGASACATPGDVCHPVQLWGFSGREVNEIYGACAPVPEPGPPR